MAPSPAVLPQNARRRLKQIQTPRPTALDLSGDATEDEADIPSAGSSDSKKSRRETVDPQASPSPKGHSASKENLNTPGSSASATFSPRGTPQTPSFSFDVCRVRRGTIDSEDDYLERVQSLSDIQRACGLPKTDLS